MPYNTRRKSISLSSLGIQVPNSTRSHRSNSKSDSPDHMPVDHSPPAKRVKREHGSPSALPSPRRTPSLDIDTKTTQLQSRPAAHTPPASPIPEDAPRRKLDRDGIKDDVVVSVVDQLEKTGNRPHLLKELATVLMSTNQNLAQYVDSSFSKNAKLTLNSSANPAALLSSRLTQYMKRPWTALSPCPIAKELVPVHPRKVFFFLTTQPRGELPVNSDDILPPALDASKRLTPSISDPSVEEDDEAMDRHERMRFSPSPEIELHSPELDTKTPVPEMPGSPLSMHSSLHEVEPQHRPRTSNRAPSPGLEADERGFTETASAVRASKLLQQTSQLQITVQEAFEQPKQKTDQEAGIELFGRSHGGLAVAETMSKQMMSSPLIAPKQNTHLHIHDIEMDMGDGSWNIKSPEHTSLDELDLMFDDF